MRLLSLADSDASDRLEVGGKASELATLSQAGAAVPEGFVVPGRALALALRRAGLTEMASRVASNPDSEDAEALRAAVRCLPIPAELADDLRTRATRLGPRLAVRSSGVAEDGARRSHAGLHASRVGVAPHEVEDAVREVWASLYAPEALVYIRGSGGSGPRPDGMAVLVQRMVDAVVSGVMFTINPLNGSWREMVVEAVWGYGEGLVSGQLAPHWYLVRRPRWSGHRLTRAWSRLRLKVMQEDLPELPRRWGWDGERVSPHDTPPTLQGQRTLTPDALLRLCRLGLRLEGDRGGALDVEWAMEADGRVVVLQARPITATGRPAPRRDDVLWTRRFIGERWPDPASPLGWSIIEPLLSFFVGYPETQARHLGGGAPFRLVEGRPYVNASIFRHLAFKLPGAPAPRFIVELLPPAEELAWRSRFAAPPGVSVYLSVLRETWAEKRWERFSWNPFTNHAEWAAFERRMGSVLEAAPEAEGSRAAEARVRQLMVVMRAYIGIHITSLLFANLFFQLLEAQLDRVLPQDSRRLMALLAVSPTGNRTLETNRALWDLASLAEPGDLAHLREHGCGPPGSAFDVATRAFLATYGHRAAASWEVFSPRWGREPARLVPLLEAQGGTPDPRLRAEEQEKARSAALRELTRLTSGGDRLLLLGLAYYTRRYLLLRENQRFWFDGLLARMHAGLLRLGEILVERGALADADDVAYLTWTEVEGLLRGQLLIEAVPEWVERRRAEREAAGALEPPVFLSGDEELATARSGVRLRGQGISGGRARGRVRVLRSPAEGGRLAEGDILVAHAIDPSWTPLFQRAGAVVSELGSALSHGAVVAREYGLPMVVNLEGATRRLCEGEEVTVDGYRGEVWAHP